MSPYWPNTSVFKSMNNAFTAHIREPRSAFCGDPQFRANAAPQPKTDAEAVLAKRHSGTYAKAGRVE